MADLIWTSGSQYEASQGRPYLGLAPGRLAGLAGAEPADSSLKVDPALSWMSPRPESQRCSAARKLVGWSALLGRRTSHESCFSVQFQAECSNDLEDGAEAGSSLSRERLVKTLAGQAGVTCYLRHAFGARNIAQSFGDESSVAICLLKASFQISSHFLWSAKVLGDIVTGSLTDLNHDPIVAHRLHPVNSSAWPFSFATGPGGSGVRPVWFSQMDLSGKPILLILFIPSKFLFKESARQK